MGERGGGGEGGVVGGERDEGGGWGRRFTCTKVMRNLCT